jgi:hypothetical protein
VRGEGRAAQSHAGSISLATIMQGVDNTIASVLLSPLDTLALSDLPRRILTQGTAIVSIPILLLVPCPRRMGWVMPGRPRTAASHRIPDYQP